MWTIPKAGLKYAPLFEAAETKYKLPKNLLARVAYQESHFREDIISGKKISSAGAVGIMQIVPKWHPGVDALNPQEAIPYAAKYLKQLYKQFGTWGLAIMAYNTGPGNLKKILKGEKKLPRETSRYLTQISDDIYIV